ncbi:MAG TPA: DUF2911 domain-containing protein [Terriglobales bacterium]|nr:DUF2911 domain-containing protein [Terriglobales bacterium]
MKKFSVLVLLLFVFASLAAAQQDKSKRPSPPASATCSAGGASITIDYSSPRMKGRKIFGGLVPFGQIWRTGANEATTFVTTADVSVGGQSVPAGSYTLFTIPEDAKWTLVISKKTGEWGTDYPGESNDLVRVPMSVSKTAAPVENFTIGFDQAGGKCALHMDWENTRASVDVVKK